ncbi:MAG: phosphatase [Leadbetterella sp.]
MKKRSLVCILVCFLSITACYKDELEELQNQYKELEQRIVSIETVNKQLTDISANLSAIDKKLTELEKAQTSQQATQKQLAEEHAKVAKLQVLTHQLYILAENNFLDLNVVSTLLKEVNENISKKEYDKSISALETFINSVSPTEIKLKDRSVSPSAKNFLTLKPGFENLEMFTMLTSEDVLSLSPNFVYGSGADGAALYKNNDGTFSLLNNLEFDFSVARITFDKSFKPVRGEYILNASGSGNTIMCSGTLATPQEHGFGPLYLAGAESDGNRMGIIAIDPNKKAVNRNEGKFLPALGEWYAENAVPLHKDAYPNKTVIMIGDDHGIDASPEGQFALYVGDRGDLEKGKLYTLKLKNNFRVEALMKENESYEFEMVEMNQRNINALAAEGIQKGVMSFSRVEDIDYRKGSEANHREAYFSVTGRKSNALLGRGTFYGRMYRLNFDANSPLSGKITCILDGDLPTGKAKAFHSPDNVMVTENYVYIVEDPNGYPDNADKTHFAQMYQYNILTGELKTVLECNQTQAANLGFGLASKTWELSGLTDISETIGVPNTFLFVTQNHGWVPKDGTSFTDPDANVPNKNNERNLEGSMMFVIKGLPR